MWTRLRRGVLATALRLARRRLDEDARQEIDAHLELLTDHYLRQGLSPDEAYTAARRQFGNAALDARGSPRDEHHRLDRAGWLRISATRSGSCARSPGFAAVVTATLGLGIGGTTAVFSVVQAVLLAPLPYEQPGQLVRFYQQEPDKPDTRDVLAGDALHVPSPARGVVRGRRGARPLLARPVSTW